MQNSEKIIKKIADAREYEAGYRTQAGAAYDIYSQQFSMYSRGGYGNRDNFFFNKTKRQSNIYFSNVETLKGLIVPEVPNLNITINPTKRFALNNTPENRDDQSFYSTTAAVLSSITKNFIDKFEKFNWQKFKLDYLITGRGVLWVNFFPEDKNIKIEHVSWQDFIMDPKKRFDEVEWVARRILFTKKRFKNFFPDASLAKLSGTLGIKEIYFDDAFQTGINDLSTYVEVWEYWDKTAKMQYYVSQQYNSNAEGATRYVIAQRHIKNIEADHFFPCSAPPTTIYNGRDMLPMSDVWNYKEELDHLSNITKKRYELVRYLVLHGFAAVTNQPLIDQIKNNNTMGANDVIVTVPGFLPSPNEPIVTYLDNTPRIQLIEQLQNEYEIITKNIYNITGISEQMRNVSTGDDDELATSVRFKTKFGSRRLKDFQTDLLNYWSEICKIIISRVSNFYDVDDYSEIILSDIKLDNRDEIQNAVFQKTNLEKQLQEIQSQMQEAQAQAQQQQYVQQQTSQPINDQPIDDQGSPSQPDVSDSPAPPDNPTSVEGGQSLEGGQGTAPDQQETAGGQPPPSDATSGGAIAPMQPLPPPDMAPSSGGRDQPQLAQLQQQNDQLLQQEMSVNEQYEKLTGEITWQKIVDFLQKDKMVSFLISASLDDLENKAISDERNQSDLNYMTTIMGAVNQVIANVNSNPKFAEIYCSLFAMSIDGFDQTKSQRQSIDNFINDLKQQAKELVDNPPQPQAPPPTPEQIKAEAQAEESKAKAQLLAAQTDEIRQKLQTPPPPPDNADDGNEMAQLQMKHEHDMQLEQMKIAADNQRAMHKIESDEKLMQMKIAADDNRYKEKIQSDLVTKQNLSPERTESQF
jgi:hypothetical protein